MHTRWLPILFILLLSHISFLGVTFSEAETTSRAFILLIDQLTWTDILCSSYPALFELANAAAVGHMNTRTAGITNPENAGVTLGASSRALGSTNSGQAFDKDTPLMVDPTATSDELFVATQHIQLNEQITAAQVYTRRTGKKSSHNILHLGIAEIVARNKSLPYTVVPGALGEALKQAGIPVAYFGNSDTTQPKRHLTTFLMDQNGTIPMGTIECPTRFDEAFPLNKRTDYQKLWEMIQKSAPTSGVIAIELGELARLYSFRSHYDQSAFEAIKHQALKEIDQFVGQVINNLNPADRLLVIVPSPPRHLLTEKESFTPVILWTNNALSEAHDPIKGILLSPTTRRLGIITNTDIAPTILNFFDIETPSVMYGRVVTVKKHAQPVSYLSEQRERIIHVNKQRQSLLKSLVYADIILYLAATFCILVKKIPRWLGSTIYIGLPFMKSMPLALLLLPLLEPKNPKMAFIGATVLSGIIFLSVRLVSRHPMKLITLLSLITTLVILADTLTGNQLVKNSILGYDPMGGARFYGIGNEYMGVIVGAAIIGTTPLIDLYPAYEKALKYGITVLYTVITLAISLPILGANVGGALTATIGFSVTLLLLYHHPITFKTIMIMALVPILVIAMNSIVDQLFANWNTSHLGQAIRLIKVRGSEEIYSIIARKVAMNIKLLRYSVWSRVLIVALGVIIWFLYQPPTLIRQIKNKYPNLVRGLIGSTTAALAALVFNDSGVVAAALVLNFTATAILFLGVRRTRGIPID